MRVQMAQYYTQSEKVIKFNKHHHTNHTIIFNAVSANIEKSSTSSLNSRGRFDEKSLWTLNGRSRAQQSVLMTTNFN